MNQDIEKAIQVIDDKIKQLENARNTLVDLFGGQSSGRSTQEKTVNDEPTEKIRKIPL